MPANSTRHIEVLLPRGSITYQQTINNLSVATSVNNTKTGKFPKSLSAAGSIVRTLKDGQSYSISCSITSGLAKKDLKPIAISSASSTNIDNLIGKLYTLTVTSTTSLVKKALRRIILSGDTNGGVRSTTTVTEGKFSFQSIAISVPTTPVIVNTVKKTITSVCATAISILRSGSMSRVSVNITVATSPIVIKETFKSFFTNVVINPLGFTQAFATIVQSSVALFKTAYKRESTSVITSVLNNVSRGGLFTLQFAVTVPVIINPKKTIQQTIQLNFDFVLPLLFSTGNAIQALVSLDILPVRVVSPFVINVPTNLVVRKRTSLAISLVSNMIPSLIKRYRTTLILSNGSNVTLLKVIGKFELVNVVISIPSLLKLVFKIINFSQNASLTIPKFLFTAININLNALTQPLKDVIKQPFVTTPINNTVNFIHVPNKLIQIITQTTPVITNFFIKKTISFSQNINIFEFHFVGNKVFIDIPHITVPTVVSPIKNIYPFRAFAVTQANAVQLFKTTEKTIATSFANTVIFSKQKFFFFIRNIAVIEVATTVNYQLLVKSIIIIPTNTITNIQKIIYHSVISIPVPINLTSLKRILKLNVFTFNTQVVFDRLPKKFIGIISNTDTTLNKFLYKDIIFIEVGQLLNLTSHIILNGAIQIIVGVGQNVLLATQYIPFLQSFVNVTLKITGFIFKPHIYRTRGRSKINPTDKNIY